MIWKLPNLLEGEVLAIRLEMTDTEKVRKFLHKLKLLLDQAMPGAETDIRIQLVLHQFITGLPAHVSKQLRAKGEVSDIDKVLERVQLLLTIEMQKKSAAIKAKEGPSFQS